MKRKILYSPGYGAGWVSWNNSRKEVALYLLTYQPIIDFLEAGNKFVHAETSVEYAKDDTPLFDTTHPILAKLYQECVEKFKEAIYMGGARDLKVMEVFGEVKIDEYDGFESVTTADDRDGWL